MDITQVPAGYKLTDLGVLPEEWEVKTLGEIAYIGSGGTPNRKIPGYWDGTIPWVTTAQINSNIIEKAEEFITDAGLQNSAAKMFKKGALLMAMYGQGKTRGKVAVLGIDATTNQACAVIELKDNAQSNYIFYNLTARYDELRQLSNSGGQENLSGSIIKKLSIALPPPNEQQAIAEALGEMDALLTAQQARLAKQRAVKQGLLQGLLSGKQRLPGFAGDWEMKRLGEVLKFQVGCPFSSTYFNQAGDGLRLIKNRDLKSDDSIYYYSGPFGSEFIVQDDDVLIGMDGDFLPCLWNKGKAVLNQRVGRIVTNSKADRTFCYYVLAKPLQDIQTNTGATTVKHLSHKDIESISLPLPEITEQRAIAAVLSEADAYLAALEAEHAKTQLLKQGMMQNLLTGKLRLV